MNMSISVVLVLALSMAALWLRSHQDVLECFLNALGWSCNPATSTSRDKRSLLTTIVIVVALLTIINPETRILVLLIDAIGIDIFLLLVLVQLRAVIAFLQHDYLPRVMLSLRRSWPLRFHGLTKKGFWQYLIWGPFSVPSPAAVRAVVSVLACICVAVRTIVELYV
jgi:hypothetical protein